VGRGVFSSPWALAAFFLVLLTISYASYRYLERPAQQFIRTKWMKLKALSVAGA
jgi:peptidoglycan/LPS O-acetylase OafA/YrhL